MTMPHVNSGGTDDFYSSDEVKIYQHEGEEENEKRSSENLSEDKYGLVTETEEEKGAYTGNKSDRRTEDGKPPSQGDREGPFGYLPNYPPYPNGSTPTTMPMPGTIPPYLFLLQGGKVPMLQSPLGVMMGYNNEAPFTSPPPAHMGIPPVTIDPKTGLPRHVYPYPTSPGQFPPSLYPDVQWQRPPGYPISSGALGGHYPPNFVNSTARYPPGFFPPGVHPGMSHPMVAGPKQEGADNQRHGFSEGSQSPQPEKKKPHIKKPLNAFMLFMKEQRAKVVAECTLKESAAINQILGRRWHSLDKSEQAKYYDMARKEKELHLQLYPGWSARDNYGTHAKKKKRPREQDPLEVEKGMRHGGSPPSAYSNWHSLDKSEQAKYYDMARKEKELHLQLYPGWSARDNYATHSKKKKRKPERPPGEKGDCTNSKKCRARYGMDQQKNWCKPCRRKKKCIRVHGTDQDTDDEDDGMSDSNAAPDSLHDSDSIMGSPACSSASEDIHTPQKSSLRHVDSPLIHHSSPLHHVSDLDATLKSQEVLPTQNSPFSMFKRDPSDNRYTPERYMSPKVHIPSMSSPASVKSDSSQSYSIDALAKSSVKSSDRIDQNSSFECVLSPLSSPGDLGHPHSPHFSLSTFTEDINRNLSPKKKASGLSSSFSISTLSVSAVTPSRVHCS